MDSKKPELPGDRTSTQPHYYGKKDGVHVFHATDESHTELIGEHLHSPDDAQYEAAIARAKDHKKGAVVIHGTPPPKLMHKFELKKNEGEDLKKAFQSFVDFKGYAPAVSKSGSYAQWHLTKPQLRHIIDNYDKVASFDKVLDNKREDLNDRHHSTAITRKTAPVPIRDYLSKFGQGDKRKKSILYHGVGRDIPGMAALANKGKNRVAGYDPYHPDAEVRQMPDGQFDEVHSHYTLNVVDHSTGKKILEELHDKLKDDGHVVISVRRDLKKTEPVSFEELQKSYLHNDNQTQTNLQVHTGSLAQAPDELMQWGTDHLVPMKKDDFNTFDFHGKILKVRKYDADLYNGWVEGTDGKQLHTFERVTLPELMIQLQSKLELYGKESVPEAQKPEATDDTTKEESSLEIVKQAHAHLKSVFDRVGMDMPHGLNNLELAIAARIKPKAEARLKELRQKLKSQPKPELNPAPAVDETKVELPKKDILGGMLNPEPACDACGSTASFCECYSGLPRPRIELDLKQGKLTILFKSEWDEESKESFIEDLKLRAGQILRNKMRT